MSTKSDDERMHEVDAVRIRQPLSNRNKQTDVGALRFHRRAGHHNLMLPACWCPQPFRVGKPGGICLTCQGAVLTGDEAKQQKKLSGPPPLLS